MGRIWAGLQVARQSLGDTWEQSLEEGRVGFGLQLRVQSIMVEVIAAGIETAAPLASAVPAGRGGWWPSAPFLLLC